MTPFSAFFVIFAGLVAQAEHDDKSKAEPGMPAVAPMPERGDHYKQGDVFTFDTAGDCAMPAGIDPILCVADPALTALPVTDQAWLSLVAKASRAFLYGFADTAQAAKSKIAAVTLNSHADTLAVLKNGLNPTGVSGVKIQPNEGKGYQLISYDMRICSLGGKVSVRLLDRNPIGELGAGDAFSIRETACGEANFSTATGVLSNSFTEIESVTPDGINLLSQGRLARSFAGKQYVGSTVALDQTVKPIASGSITTISNGAMGYCESAQQGKINWEDQCKANGVVLDGLKITKTQTQSGIAFPGTAYAAVSMATGQTGNMPEPDKFELVGKDIQINKGAQYPHAGILTLVGANGEKVRLEFAGTNVNASRITPGQSPTTISMPTRQLIGQ